MGKWEPYSRGQLRQLRASYLRRNARIVAIIASAIALSGALSTWSVLALAGGVFRWYVLGAMHVALVATGLHAVHSAFLAMDREALRHVRGAWGEDNTRSELGRAKRRRLVWGWVDSISLKAGDLDHVVVTRRGGIVAIDSKWRNEVDRDSLAAMARSASKARLRTEALALQILKTERHAKHRTPGKSHTVVPVVVLWGAAQAGVPTGGREINGVTFIAGRELVPWLRTLENDYVAKVAAQEVLGRLREFRATAGQHREVDA